MGELPFSWPEYRDKALRNESVFLEPLSLFTIHCNLRKGYCISSEIKELNTIFFDILRQKQEKIWIFMVTPWTIFSVVCYTMYYFIRFDTHEYLLFDNILLLCLCWGFTIPVITLIIGDVMLGSVCLEGYLRACFHGATCFGIIPRLFGCFRFDIYNWDFPIAIFNGQNSKELEKSLSSGATSLQFANFDNKQSHSDEKKIDEKSVFGGDKENEDTKSSEGSSNSSCIYSKKNNFKSECHKDSFKHVSATFSKRRDILYLIVCILYTILFIIILIPDPNTLKWLAPIINKQVIFSSEWMHLDHDKKAEFSGNGNLIVFNDAQAYIACPLIFYIVIFRVVVFKPGVQMLLRSIACAILIIFYLLNGCDFGKIFSFGLAWLTVVLHFESLDAQFSWHREIYIFLLNHISNSKMNEHSRALVASSGLQRSFFMKITHDLRTPLNALIHATTFSIDDLGCTLKAIRNLFTLGQPAIQEQLSRLNQEDIQESFNVLGADFEETKDHSPKILTNNQKHFSSMNKSFSTELESTNCIVITTENDLNTAGTSKIRRLTAADLKSVISLKDLLKKKNTSTNSIDHDRSSCSSLDNDENDFLLSSSEQFHCSISKDEDEKNDINNMNLSDNAKFFAQVKCTLEVEEDKLQNKTNYEKTTGRYSSSSLAAQINDFSKPLSENFLDVHVTKSFSRSRPNKEITSSSFEDISSPLNDRIVIQRSLRDDSRSKLDVVIENNNNLSTSENNFKETTKLCTTNHYVNHDIHADNNNNSSNTNDNKNINLYFQPPGRLSDSIDNNKPINNSAFSFVCDIIHDHSSTAALRSKQLEYELLRQYPLSKDLMDAILFYIKSSNGLTDALKHLQTIRSCGVLINTLTTNLLEVSRLDFNNQNSSNNMNTTENNKLNHPNSAPTDIQFLDSAYHFSDNEDTDEKLKYNCCKFLSSCCSDENTDESFHTSQKHLSSKKYLRSWSCTSLEKSPFACNDDFPANPDCDADRTAKILDAIMAENNFEYGYAKSVSDRIMKSWTYSVLEWLQASCRSLNPMSCLNRWKLKRLRRENQLKNKIHEDSKKNELEEGDNVGISEKSTIFLTDIKIEKNTDAEMNKYKNNNNDSIEITNHEIEISSSSSREIDEFSSSEFSSSSSHADVLPVLFKQSPSFAPSQITAIATKMSDIDLVALIRTVVAINLPSARVKNLKLIVSGLINPFSRDPIDTLSAAPHWIDDLAYDLTNDPILNMKISSSNASATILDWYESMYHSESDEDDANDSETYDEPLESDFTLDHLKENNNNTLHENEKLKKKKSLDKQIPVSQHGTLPVWLDPVRLTQCLNNLIGNSIKYTEVGQIDITLRAFDFSNCHSSPPANSQFVSYTSSPNNIGKRNKSSHHAKSKDRNKVRGTQILSVDPSHSTAPHLELNANKLSPSANSLILQCVSAGDSSIENRLRRGSLTSSGGEGILNTWSNPNKYYNNIIKNSAAPISFSPSSSHSFNLQSSHHGHLENKRNIVRMVNRRDSSPPIQSYNDNIIGNDELKNGKGSKRSNISLSDSDAGDADVRHPLPHASYPIVAHDSQQSKKIKPSLSKLKSSNRRGEREPSIPRSLLPPLPPNTCYLHSNRSLARAFRSVLPPEVSLPLFATLPVPLQDPEQLPSFFNQNSNSSSIGLTIVRILIRDSGRGIPVASLGSLFEEFSQVYGGDSVMGTGLGLGVTRLFLNLFGGDVCLASSGEGKGTFALMQIPCYRFVGSRGERSSWVNFDYNIGNVNNNNNHNLGQVTGQNISTTAATSNFNPAGIRSFGSSVNNNNNQILGSSIIDEIESKGLQNTLSSAFIKAVQAPSSEPIESLKLPGSTFDLQPQKLPSTQTADLKTNSSALARTSTLTNIVDKTLTALGTASTARLLNNAKATHDTMDSRFLEFLTSLPSTENVASAINKLSCRMNQNQLQNYNQPQKLLKSVTSLNAKYVPNTPNIVNNSLTNTSMNQFNLNWIIQNPNLQLNLNSNSANYSAGPFHRSNSILSNFGNGRLLSRQVTAISPEDNPPNASYENFNENLKQVDPSVFLEDLTKNNYHQKISSPSRTQQSNNFQQPEQLNDMLNDIPMPLQRGVSAPSTSISMSRLACHRQAIIDLAPEVPLEVAENFFSLLRNLSPIDTFIHVLCGFILCVDDDALNREVMRIIMEKKLKAKKRFGLAVDGDNAFEKINRFCNLESSSLAGCPLIIISDLEMGHSGGLFLGDKITSLEKSITDKLMQDNWKENSNASVDQVLWKLPKLFPVLCSAQDEEGIRFKWGGHSGLRAYKRIVPKPFTFNQLEGCLRSAIVLFLRDASRLRDALLRFWKLNQKAHYVLDSDPFNERKTLMKVTA